MKIRLSTQFIRFRLSPSELIKLSQQGRLQENILLSTNGSENLNFEVLLSSDIEQLAFQSDHRCVRVLFPKSLMSEWISGAKISYELKHAVGDNRLKIVIEKDLE